MLRDARRTAAGLFDLEGPFVQSGLPPLGIHTPLFACKNYTSYTCIMPSKANWDEDSDVEAGKLVKSGGTKAVGLRVTIFVMAGFMIVLSPLLFLMLIAVSLNGSESGQGTPYGLQPVTYIAISVGVLAGILSCIGGDRAGSKSGLGWTITTWICYLANFILFGVAVSFGDSSGPVVFLLCAVLIAQLVSSVCFTFMYLIKGVKPLHGSC